MWYTVVWEFLTGWLKSATPPAAQRPDWEAVGNSWKTIVETLQQRVDALEEGREKDRQEHEEREKEAAARLEACYQRDHLKALELTRQRGQIRQMARDIEDLRRGQKGGGGA